MREMVIRRCGKTLPFRGHRLSFLTSKHRLLRDLQLVLFPQECRIFPQLGFASKQLVNDSPGEIAQSSPNTRRLLREQWPM